MASFNKVILVGNLTRDPELRVTPKGTAICSFGLAVNRDFKDANGEKRQEVTFVDVEAWEKRGEVIAKFMTKGRPMLVEGRLKMDEWEDKQTGQKRSKLKVVLESFTFLGSKQDSEGSQADAPDESNQERHTPQPPTPRRTPPPKAAKPDQDEDVPF